jgi:hypothetical protein
MDCLGQQNRLVEAAAEQPGPMQRHRYQDIGAFQHVTADATHPAAEGAGEMRLVAMLQHQHQATAVPVVAQHRARPVPARAPTGAVGQTAPSPIGSGNGRPQTAHHGGAKKLIAAQHNPHSASMSSTVAPQAKQRGGSTPSTTARPRRRRRGGRVAASCIARNHRADTGRVNR